MQDETNPNDSAEQSGQTSQEVAPKISHVYYEVGADVFSKPNALCDILEVEGCPPACIFCNTPTDADLVEVILKKRGISALKLIGHVPPMRSARALKQVKNGEVSCLVVTDVSGQAIDVEELELVVNYALPTDPEVYIHRCGHSRSGAKLAKVASLIAALDLTHLHYLRKIVEFDIDKAELPAKGQLSAAKLSTIRKQAIELSDVKDDRLTELTALVLGDTEKEAIISLLLRNTLDLLPSLQAGSQREEEQYSDERESRGDRGGDYGDRGGRGGRGGDRQSRGGDRGPARGGDRGGDRGQDRAPRGRFDEQGGGNRYEGGPRFNEDSFGNSEGSGGDYDQPRGRRSRDQGDEDRPRRERTPYIPPEKHARVYLGHGNEQGITREKLNELLTTECKIDATAIKLSNVRSNYSFFDIPEETADAVIDTLNEVQFGKGKLFARRATTVSVPRPQGERSPEEGQSDEGRNESRRTEAQSSEEEGSDDDSMQTGL